MGARRWFRLVVVLALSAGVWGIGQQVAGASLDAQGQEPEPVTVADLNLLHGLFCQPYETDWCKAPARVDILAKWLEDSGCPDLVGLQEIAPRLEALLKEMVTTVCEGDYQLGLYDEGSPDREMVLSKLPILEAGYYDLANIPWETWYVRVSSPQGPVDFITAHFASSTNNPPCDASNCPPVCAAGIETNECHAHQIVDFFANRSEPAVMSILAGDLNATPGSPTLNALTDAGFVDAWVESGEPECDPETGKGCTGCSENEKKKYIGMETKSGLACDARIDFILVRTESGCDLEVTTDGFAHEPLKKKIGGLYWPSDHRGLQATLACGSG